MQKAKVRRDFGLTWKSRLGEARLRAAAPGPRLTDQQIASLQNAMSRLDVSSPHNKALLWSGKDVPTSVPINETDPNGPMWWDKLSCLEVDVFRGLGLAFSLEDTQGGRFLHDLQLNYPQNDPLSAVARGLWDALSCRFAAAVTGCIEVIAEGAFDDGVFRTVELEAVLSNHKITTINGLARRYFPSSCDDAYFLLRRWDVERSRRYYEFIIACADATSYERAMALDDLREIQLWYEQDFFSHLGPNRELPGLPDGVAEASDQAQVAGTWKYSAAWREFVQQTEAECR
ncbi:hypothetical protein GCM10009092_24930 [Bowmanella denitrificans]|uniref:Uncharacterized protein n=1 Tax=Bowmanella denitrificans TaxID=366582 RepID=A0ABN0XAZ4_9ALTE